MRVLVQNVRMRIIPILIVSLPDVSVQDVPVCARFSPRQMFISGSFVFMVSICNESVCRILRLRDVQKRAYRLQDVSVQDVSVWDIFLFI